MHTVSLLKRRLSPALALLAFLTAAFSLWSTPSKAIYEVADNVPAATLLIPYFEVDTANANGRTTIVNVVNTSASSMLLNVTLWTNAGVPVGRFNAYLTGYDVVNFNLRDVLNGQPPQTASDGQDPTDTISPQGPISQDINFASCNTSGTTPLPSNAIGLPVGGPSGSPAPASEVRALLTGAASTVYAPGQCFGIPQGDAVARGYITIDTVNSCNVATPASVGYHSDLISTRQNTLTGDFALLDPSTGQMQYESAVAVEAPLPPLPASGQYTFYGRFVGWNATDFREPLPGAWVVQGDTGTTRAVVWRDSKQANPGPFACSTTPAPLPLGQEGLAHFEASSRYNDPAVVVPPPATVRPAPLVTQVSAFNTTNWAIPAAVKTGFVFANLHTSIAGNANPPEDPLAAQSYVLILRTPKAGGFSTGAVATPMDNAGQARHFTPSDN
jgi:hypothetical protein